MRNYAANSYPPSGDPVALSRGKGGDRMASTAVTFGEQKNFAVQVAKEKAAVEWASGQVR